MKRLPEEAVEERSRRAPGKSISHLPQDLFPEGAKAGWWMKAAQLDLEAKGVIAREKTKPLRWHKR